MADVYDKSKRSEIMSLIRSKNTQAEMLAFAYLRKHKIYHQKHYSKVAGKPDIALPRQRKAVFIDGDFWHGRTLDKLKSRRPADDYWVVKITRNMARDAEQRNQLRSDGWLVLEIWEDDIKRKRTRDTTLEQIASFLVG